VAGVAVHEADSSHTVVTCPFCGGDMPVCAAPQEEEAEADAAGLAAHEAERQRRMEALQQRQQEERTRRGRRIQLLQA
jgi:hypothetical protein